MSLAERNLENLPSGSNYTHLISGAAQGKHPGKLSPRSDELSTSASSSRIANDLTDVLAY